MWAVFVFAPPLAATLCKGRRSPVMHRSTRSQPRAGCHVSCCSLLTSTVQVCFDLYSPAQPLPSTSSLCPGHKLNGSQGHACCLWLPGEAFSYCNSFNLPPRRFSPPFWGQILVQADRDFSQIRVSLLSNDLTLPSLLQ